MLLQEKAQRKTRIIVHIGDYVKGVSMQCNQPDTEQWKVI